MEDDEGMLESKTRGGAFSESQRPAEGVSKWVVYGVDKVLIRECSMLRSSRVVIDRWCAVSFTVLLGTICCCV